MLTRPRTAARSAFLLPSRSTCDKALWLREGKETDAKNAVMPTFREDPVDDSETALAEFLYDFVVVIAGPVVSLGLQLSVCELKDQNGKAYFA